jgi:hypothetical protein
MHQFKSLLREGRYIGFSRSLRLHSQLPQLTLPQQSLYETM